MGLVQYDSSDEDEEVQTPVEPQVNISLCTHRQRSMLTIHAATS
jgi:hypothetical protein